MSKLPFVCLNVEPESDIDEDVDNTAEIQLEEALKLYQAALKYHAQGPRCYDQARVAYDELFGSEIFKYPEARSFSKRQTLVNASSSSDDGSSHEDHSDSESDLDGYYEHRVSSSLPSTLPQVLYLSFKNYAQFQLDVLVCDLDTAGCAGRCIDALDVDLKRKALQRARICLESFCDAVDRDNSDPDVWRQMSRLAALLGSPRLTRYCLEAALRVDWSSDTSIGQSLESALVLEDLQDICKVIQDDLSDELEAKARYGKPRISPGIRAILDPCPGLPASSQGKNNAELPKRSSATIRLSDRSWTGLGQAILRHCQSEQKSSKTLDLMGMGCKIETQSRNIGKGESKAGRRRQHTDNSDARCSSTSRQIMTVVGEPIEGEQNPEPIADEVREGFTSSSGGRQLPMRTMSAEMSKTGVPCQFPKDDNESKAAKSSNLKRSPDVAGIAQEHPEARGRSKRLRARETGADEEALSRDHRQYIEKQMKPLIDADRHLFDICDTLLSRMGITDFGTLDAARDTAADSYSPNDDDRSPFAYAMADFKQCLKAWNSNRSSLLTQGTGAGATATLISKGNEAGLASFMEHAKTGQSRVQGQIPLLTSQGLEEFVSLVNSDWLNVDDLAFAWLLSVIGPSVQGEPGLRARLSSNFLKFQWGKVLKTTVHDILLNQDGHLFGGLTNEFHSWRSKYINPSNQVKKELTCYVELIQSMFEIHLDMFNSMIKPTSKVDQPTRILQKARLQKWKMLSSQAIAKLNSTDEDGLDMISLRHLYSMILCLSLDESNAREQIILGLHEVSDLLKKSGMSALSLPNIDIMPEISVEAIEKEISRLTTTDFFMSVFNPRDEDPVTTIESLEPILMPSSDGALSDKPSSPSTQLQEEVLQPSKLPELSQREQLLEFMGKSTASLRLSLWNRLSAAYSAIDYPPMVFVCTTRSLDVVLSELRTSAYLAQPTEVRQANLLVWLRNIIDLVDRCVGLCASEVTALDAMDDTNLHIALVTVSHCTKIFHIFALWDDGIRLGQSNLPPQQAGGVNAYKQAMSLLRDIQVKTWRLLYMLLKESARQNKNIFVEANDDFLAYLAAIHSAVGLREYCKLAKKSFLKFLKTEILSLEPSDLNEWRYQMAQLAYDLYDLRVLADSNTWMTLQEHNCPADQMDRLTAREILPMVMAQINGMKLKDLTKPDRREFKQAIDKIQELIGVPKATSPSQIFNRRQLNAFLKTPLRKEDFENCLKGSGGFTNKPVKNEYGPIAETGWFFVVGYLRLASFRSVRRQGPDSIKELDDAMTFLKVDIDYDCEKWETWYRLAQVYDSMLDEEVAWTTDRINNKMDDLIGLQRQAIHCYQVATALAVKYATPSVSENRSQSEELACAISELYSDFGTRMYAASRPPFNMEAFSVKDHGRWYYTPMGHKFKARPFVPLRDAQVWLIASVLFRNALVDRSADWLNWYMLGKSLWKLLRHPDAGGMTKESVLEAFARACEIAPAKDPRRDGSPTLEPHQKLVSVVHKLVHSQGQKDFLLSEAGTKYMSREEGYVYLLRSAYAKRVAFENPKGPSEWLAFVRGIIKNLRTADKTNWHHRIVARAADLAFCDANEQSPAKASLLQLDTIITKSMALTVWRPAFERVGRHFVYTTRYVKLIIELLEETGDRPKLELLGKRVRKKQAEFINHPAIWYKICKAHINLLRIQADIPELHEEKVLSALPFEKFVYSAALLQAWAQPMTGEPPDHQLLPVLRELFDLKKLNLNLIPNQGIDDLIGDTYAKLYSEMVPGLVVNATTEKNREAMRVDRILMGEADAEEKGIASGAEAVALTNPSGRAKIVGRMEVRRRAEALVQRLPTSQPATNPQPLSFVDAENGEVPEDAASHGHSQSPDPNDDADDESELSEIEDEEQGDEEGQENGESQQEDMDQEGEDEQEDDDENLGDDEGPNEEETEETIQITHTSGNIEGDDEDISGIEEQYHSM